MSYKLEKPYTDAQRADFVVVHNHQNGRKIEETATALYALEAYELLEGDIVVDNTAAYEAEQLALAKEAKVQEATDKAYSFEQRDAVITVNATHFVTRAGGVYHIEGNLTNNIKMSAYASALGEADVVPWNTKENVNILLNKAACATLTALMSRMNAKLWTVDFPAYLAQIEDAATAEAVRAIEIDYQSPTEVVDISVSSAVDEDVEEEPAGEVTNENTTNNDVPEVQEEPAADIVQSKSTKK